MLVTSESGIGRRPLLLRIVGLRLLLAVRFFMGESLLRGILSRVCGDV